MANPEHLAILMDGVPAWNRWRKQNPYVRPWLANADLSGMRLTQANFSWTGLREAKLRKSILDRADFRGADPEGADVSECTAFMADFSRAQLRQVRFTNSNLCSAVFTSAIFRKARLVGANFEKSILSGTRISRCSVDGTNFIGSRLYEVSFIDLDLSATKGLAACHHRGPSMVDRRTLMRSSKLPQNFLRGCGLSDWEIEVAELYRHNLSSRDVIEIGYKLIELRNVQPIQYFSCFISYSHKDKAFAQRLHDSYRNKGYGAGSMRKISCPATTFFSQ